MRIPDVEDLNLPVGFERDVVETPRGRSDPILQWLAPSQRSDRRLRRLIEIELAYYVFPAGRVLTTGDFRGANLGLPPGRWEMTMPLRQRLSPRGRASRAIERASRLNTERPLGWASVRE